jgi:DNA-binding transcriptional regulator YbjK
VPAPAKLRRASAQRRRAALLAAAGDLAAEVGAGAVTHRAVAERAGVPLSTTSYFFSSIDELVTEALRARADERSVAIEETERAAIDDQLGSAAEVIEAVVDRALAADERAQGGEVELFLAAGRRDDLRPHAAATVDGCVERAARQFARMGSGRADEVAWAVTALDDGAMLHRLAGVDGDHRARLTAGLRLLVAAAMLRDDELDELLGRYGSGGAPR